MIYEYKCKDITCNTTFELIRKLSEKDDPAECPACGKDDCRKVLSIFGKHLSWSQWRALD